jgi:hypothetical protein
MINRTVAQRKSAALQRLESEANVWVATASQEGVPHLVPLSLAWDGTSILVATPTESATVRNALGSGRVRVTLDSADDVVIFDTDATISDFATADEATRQNYIDRVGWDPSDEPGAWSLVVLTSRRIQAWNGVGEIDGRTIMRDGAWA